MAEEHIQQPTPRGKGRRERVEYARSRDILDVASELNMELVFPPPRRRCHFTC